MVSEVTQLIYDTDIMPLKIHQFNVYDLTHIQTSIRYALWLCLITFNHFYSISKVNFL